MTLARQLVAGVNLHGEVVVGIDELDEEREALAEAIQHAAANKAGAMRADQFVEGCARFGAARHDGAPAFDIGELPALADLTRISGQAFEGANGCAAPEHFFQNRVE